MRVGVQRRAVQGGGAGSCTSSAHRSDDMSGMLGGLWKRAGAAYRAQVGEQLASRGARVPPRLAACRRDRVALAASESEGAG